MLHTFTHCKPFLKHLQFFDETQIISSDYIQNTKRGMSIYEKLKQIATNIKNPFYAFFIVVGTRILVFDTQASTAQQLQQMNMLSGRRIRIYHIFNSTGQNTRIDFGFLRIKILNNQEKTFLYQKIAQDQSALWTTDGLLYIESVGGKLFPNRILYAYAQNTLKSHTIS